MLLTLVFLTVPFDEFEFVSDTSKVYTKGFAGHLDRFGNFVPFPESFVSFPESGPIGTLKTPPRGSGFGRGPHLMSETLHTKRTNQVYEFRSNRLIQGAISLTTAQFIPDVGSSIIDFSEYKYSPEARPIYNLPGKFVSKKDAKKKQDDLPALPATKPATSNPTKKQDNPQPSATDQEYDFKQDLSVEYSRQFGDWLYFGTLDEYGEFVFSGTKKPVNVATRTPKFYLGTYVPLMSHVKQKEVYEFRSKTLIPGVIEKGEFVPDIGGKIIDFDDYKYSKDARPIYNLPGMFMPKEKGK